MRYPHHHLLVFGDTEALADSVYETVEDATRALAAWPVWALFTPEALHRPYVRLHVLQTYFRATPRGIHAPGGSYPLTSEGLLACVDDLAVRSGRRGTRDEVELPSLAPEPPLFSGAVPIGDYLQKLRTEYLEAKRHSPEASGHLFAWLCAATLAPRIHYETTIKIG